MLLIYQIGNFRVNLVASSNQGLSYDAPIDFRRASSELTSVPGDVSYITPGRPLAKANTLKAEGALICGASDTCASVDQQFNRMVSSGGDIVPIIAVVPAECCPCLNCGGDGCSYCGSRPESMWLVSYGVPTKYTSSYSQEASSDFGMGELNISVTIEGVTYWEPLNDIEWRYWGNNKPLYPDLTSGVKKYFHPYNPNWNGSALSGFQYTDGSYMYDPANWILAYSSVRGRRKRAALVGDDYTAPTLSVSVGSPITHSFEVPVENWPATPRSMYYFSNLPQSGEILLEVESYTLQGILISNTAMLDLAVLNANPALSGISAADAIVAGNFSGLYNGLYLLGGGTIVPLYIPWERDGLYPGETSLGKNTITVTVTNMSETIDFAYAHIFRKY